MKPEPPFFAWSQSRPNLVVAAGSGTSDFRSQSRPKKWRLRNTAIYEKYRNLPISHLEFLRMFWTFLFLLHVFNIVFTMDIFKLFYYGPKEKATTTGNKSLNNMLPVPIRRKRLPKKIIVFCIYLGREACRIFSRGQGSPGLRWTSPTETWYLVIQQILGSLISLKLEVSLQAQSECF